MNKLFGRNAELRDELRNCHAVAGQVKEDYMKSLQKVSASSSVYYIYEREARLWKTLENYRILVMLLFIMEISEIVMPHMAVLLFLEQNIS